MDSHRTTCSPPDTSSLVHPSGWQPWASAAWNLWVKSVPPHEYTRGSLVRDGSELLPRRGHTCSISIAKQVSHFPRGLPKLHRRASHDEHFPNTAGASPQWLRARTCCATAPGPSWSAAPGISSDSGTLSLHPWAQGPCTRGCTWPYLRGSDGFPGRVWSQCGPHPRGSSPQGSMSYEAAKAGVDDAKAGVGDAARGHLDDRINAGANLSNMVYAPLALFRVPSRRSIEIA